MKMSSLVCSAVLLLPAGSAFAAGAVTFPLSVATSKDVHYVCKDNKDITVSYVNATNGDAFAYLPVDGAPHVFVGVTSGPARATRPAATSGGTRATPAR